MRRVSGEITWVDLKLGRLQLKDDASPYRIMEHETRVKGPSDDEFLSVKDLQPGQEAILEVSKGKEGKTIQRIIVNTTLVDDYQGSYGGSPYAKIVSTKGVKFLDPRELKDNTGTVIIVLGDRPLDDTTPSVDMVYRVVKGVELAQKFPEAVLVMSGGATKGPIPEAQMMGLIARSRGVDPLRIILEDKSQTTRENAQNTARIFGTKHIQQVFIVTERSRLKEDAAIFQKYGTEFKNIQAVPCDVTRDLIIAQMERFLMGHDDRVMRGRLHYVKRGIAYKAFKFVVFPIE